ncbi:MAG: hypothetical protein K2Z81_01280, partial [Cyanobacteria bacterium]|nr:hypothetical protein [Cyanobacteriota bacterium]
MAKKNEPLAIGEKRNGVWRRSKNAYYVYIKINGRIIKQSFGNDYEKAASYAERLKQEHKHEKLIGINPVLDQVVAKRPRNITVGEIILSYANQRAPFLKAGTIENYEYLISKLETIVDLSVRSLSLETIAWLISELKYKGLSNKVIKEIISLCRSAFRHAVDHDQIPYNIFDKVRIPKVEKYNPQPFTSVELQ